MKQTQSMRLNALPAPNRYPYDHIKNKTQQIVGISTHSRLQDEQSFKQ